MVNEGWTGRVNSRSDYLLPSSAVSKFMFQSVKDGEGSEPASYSTQRGEKVWLCCDPEATPHPQGIMGLFSHTDKHCGPP